MKTPKMKVARRRVGKQACKFCGCGQARPCATGCAWAESNVCTRCAATFHTGAISALGNLADALVQYDEPELNTAGYLAELRDAIEERKRLVQHFRSVGGGPPKALLDDLAAHPDPDAPDAPVEFGKGRRSSDAIEGV